MKTAVRIVLWIALFFVGASVVSTVTYHTGLPGSGAGIGFFSYRFKYMVTPHFDEGDDYLAAQIVIEGEAPKRFMIGGGVSPQYEEVKLEWMVHSGSTNSEGASVIFLNSNELDFGTRRLPLNGSNLARLLKLNLDSEPDQQLVASLLTRLHECGAGTMPKPRHHTYYFEDPTQGRLQHFAGGNSLRIPILIWTGVWVLLIVATLITKRANKAEQATGKPPSFVRESP